MIKIGCSGFPVGKKKYEARFKLAEVNERAAQPPRTGTLVKWRSQSAPGFEFIVCASRLISHPKKTNNRYGYFQNSIEVKRATDQTLFEAQTLAARTILFSMPPAMAPQADNIGRLQKFFGDLTKTTPLFLAWDAPPAWPASLVESVSQSLRLVPAGNPLFRRVKSHAPFNYFRLGDAKKTAGVHRYSDAELRDIKLACDKPLSYVIFNNGPTSFEDAVRFAALI